MECRSPRDGRPVVGPRSVLPDDQYRQGRCATAAPRRPRGRGTDTDPGVGECSAHRADARDGQSRRTSHCAGQREGRRGHPSCRTRRAPHGARDDAVSRRCDHRRRWWGNRRHPRRQHPRAARLSTPSRPASGEQCPRRLVRYCIHGCSHRHNRPGDRNRAGPARSPVEPRCTVTFRGARARFSSRSASPQRLGRRRSGNGSRRPVAFHALGPDIRGPRARAPRIRPRSSRSRRSPAGSRRARCRTARCRPKHTRRSPSR